MVYTFFPSGSLTVSSFTLPIGVDEAQVALSVPDRVKCACEASPLLVMPWLKIREGGSVAEV